MEAWDSGSLFQEGAAPLHRASSSLSPGVGFFSSCFCSVGGVSQCRGSGSFCSLPLCSWGGGAGIRTRQGWAPSPPVPRKASRQALPAAVARADAPWEGLSDHLLSSSSPDASSSPLGLQLGAAVFPEAHLSSSTHSRGRCGAVVGGGGAPALSHGPPAVAGGC